MHLISFISLNRGKVIKYQIKGWTKTNTALDYNCPCQKDTGFFFLPVSNAAEIISTERCSEMDIILDLWISTVYNDPQVEGSSIGPVVYIRNGTGSPLVSYNDLSQRWGISKATVGRILRKLEQIKYVSLVTFSGRKGSVIYLQNYLSTMFQISDVMIDNKVIGSVAMGDISTMGSITGSKAEQALHSYMGDNALEPGATGIPSYSNVEIGGGRITGTETTAEHPEGIAFGMYSTDQYAAPEGDYETVYSADGASWYKQYAADAVKKTPYKAPDGSIAYKESIIKKLPPTPKRKDKL